MALTRSVTPILPEGNPPDIESYPEEASLDIKKGAVIVDSDRDGYIQEGGTDPTDIIGFGLHDSGNNATLGAKSMLVALAIAGALFSGTLEDETNDNHVLVASDLLAEFGLTKDVTTSYWVVDENKKDTTTSRVRVVRLLDAIGDTRGRVLFTPTHDAIEFADT